MITIDRKNLEKFLRLTYKLTRGKRTMPVLNHVLLEVLNEGVLQVSATDLEIWLIDTFPITSDQTLSVSIDNKTLLDVVSGLTSDSITINTDDRQSLVIAEANGSCSGCTVPYVPGEEFPSKDLPGKRKSNWSGSVPAKDFTATLGNVAFATSKDETRYNINCVFLEKEEKSFNLVATDGHRLVKTKGIEVQTFTGEFPKLGMMIPRTAIPFLSYYAISGGAFHLMLNNDLFLDIADSNSEGFIRMKLIDGQFPDYKQVVPRSLKASYVLNRKELQKALDIAKRVCTDKPLTLRFRDLGDKIEILGSSPERGKSASWCLIQDKAKDVNIKEEDCTIGLSAKYVSDVLASTDIEEVQLGLSGEKGSDISLSPTIFETDENVMHIVMPMRFE